MNKHIRSIHNILIALDAGSARHFDENGFLHVAASHISKECVNPYYGREIPDWEGLGLDPERVYYGWRAGAELAAGAASFNGLPLLLDHYVDSAAAPQKEHRVGSLGTDAAFTAPYLDNSLIVTDAAAIAAIESGRCRELSAAYMYDPVFRPGVFDGEAYDFVMTNIRGNHVALVEEGRAGPDVVVADARINPNPKQKRTTLMGIINRFKRQTPHARDEAPASLTGPASLSAPLPQTFPTGDEGEEFLPALSGQSSPLPGDEDPETVTLDSETEGLLLKLYDELSAIVASIPDQEAASRILAIIEQLLVQLTTGANDDELSLAGPLAAGTNDPLSAAPGEALDRALSRRLGGRVLSAKDAAFVAHRHFRALSNAARSVRPLIGEVDPLAFDSARDIYKKALLLSGYNPAAYPPASWRGMCDILKNAHFGQSSAVFAADAARSATAKPGPLENLKTIRVEG